LVLAILSRFALYTGFD